MTQKISLDPSQSHESNPPKSFKQNVFTLQDGELVFTPEETSDSENLCQNFQSFFSEDFRLVDSHQDDVYIEIFRENDEMPFQGIGGGKLINSISSAYEAFWEDDFEERSRRQSCIMCRQVFLTHQQLLHHLQNLHKIVYPEECFLCHKMFVSTNQRMEHLFQDHAVTEPDLICEVCFQKFVTQDEKGIHRLFHESVIKCQWCRESFACKFLLNKHLHHCLLRRSDLECHICGCNFRSSQILQLHNLRHSRMACDICHHSLLNKSNSSFEDTEVVLIRHLKTRHSVEEIKNTLQSLRKQDEEEQNLDKMFMNQIEANLNTLSILPSSGCHIPLPLQVNNSVNQEHPDITHNGSNLVEENQVQDEIAKVRNHVATQFSLLSVNSSHMDLQETNQICSICSCKFESQEKLRAHTDTHTGNTFQCSDCRMHFKSKEKLVTHTLDHQNFLTCSVCLLKFPHRRGLKKHVRSHGIQVKPETFRYKCTMCAVSCATMSGLRIHILTHTDHKPYLCDKCGLRFRRPRALKTHDLAVHNPRSLHFCPHCDISSLSKSSLLRHIQCVHGGVKRFICGVCSARCFQNQDLRRHLKSMHNVNLPAIDRLCKKSSEEIHVIPSANHLGPTDPLSQLLQSAIKEEQSKLEALKLQKIGSNIRAENNLHHRSSELLLDSRQSLSILGDVASQAAPLEHSESTSNFTQPSQQMSKLSCGGFQYTSNSFDAHSSHFSQSFQQKSPIQTNLLKDAVPAASAKPLIIYSLAPSHTPSLSYSATPCATGMPIQLCTLPTNVEPTSLESRSGSLISNDMIGSFLPASNIGSASATPTVQYRNITAVYSSTMNNLNSIAGTELTVGHNSLITHLEESKGLPHLPVSNTLKSSKLYQFDFLNQSKDVLSHIPISVNNLSEGNSSGVEFNFGPVLSTFAPQMKSYLSSDEILENSLQGEEGTASNTSQNSNNTLQPSFTELSSSIEQNQTNSEEMKNAEYTFLANHPEVIEISAEGFPFWNPSTQTETAEVLSSELKSLKDMNIAVVSAESEIDVNFVCNEESLAHYRSVAVESAPEVHKALGKSPTSDMYNSVPFSKSDERDNNNLRLQTENVNLTNTMMKDGTTTCPECGKKLSCSSNYRRHLQIHMNNKPHKCQSCGKEFQYKCNLTVHLRTHSGARPYECHICKKKFRYQSEYKEHKQLHEESKSFKCQECGQLFARRRDLNRHSLYHHRTSKPKCHVCQKSFSRMDYLKTHMKLHGKLTHTENDEQSTSMSQDVCISNKEIGKSSSVSETSYGCERCPLLITGESEFQVHKGSCMGTKKSEDVLSVVQSEERLPQNTSDVNFNTPGNPCPLPGHSEDLISIALQAAEDGVEFMFVEGLKSSLQQPLTDQLLDNTFVHA